jgi:hypothetical protein
LRNYSVVDRKIGARFGSFVKELFHEALIFCPNHCRLSQDGVIAFKVNEASWAIEVETSFKVVYKMENCDVVLSKGEVSQGVLEFCRI